MKHVVFSPHTDDAIFSIGAYLSQLDGGISVVSPMAGLPADDAGRRKHEVLRAEHESACAELDLRISNGDFLDDVYEAPARSEVKDWMDQFFNADSIYIPFGIHHPDHLLVSNLLISMLYTSRYQPRKIYCYEELPYRVDYPELANIRFSHIENLVGRLRMLEDFTDNSRKHAAVAKYESQISDALVSKLIVRERIWELVR